MLALLRKEIRSFLNSLIGYVVIGVFLLIMGLLLWFLPTDFNILESKNADLDFLFGIAPGIFMFLIPAITMRSFAEENRTGTIEMLMTKPLTDMQIIMAKFLAGFILVIFSILPTFLYYITIYDLGDPIGNIDSGGTLGSYIGLVFLGGGFVAIGMYASVLTNNQVVSFIVSLFFCFMFYLGFDLLSNLTEVGRLDYLLQNLGIRKHYESMSSGAVDTRDLLYFISVIVFFLLLTRSRLGARKA